MKKIDYFTQFGCGYVHDINYVVIICGTVCVFNMN